MGQTREGNQTASSHVPERRGFLELADFAVTLEELAEITATRPAPTYLCPICKDIGFVQRKRQMFNRTYTYAEKCNNGNCLNWQAYRREINAKSANLEREIARHRGQDDD